MFHADQPTFHTANRLSDHPQGADNGKLSECGGDERQRHGRHGFGSLAEQKKTIRD